MLALALSLSLSDPPVGMGGFERSGTLRGLLWGEDRVSAGLNIPRIMETLRSEPLCIDLSLYFYGAVSASTSEPVGRLMPIGRAVKAWSYRLGTLSMT